LNVQIKCYSDKPNGDLTVSNAQGRLGIFSYLVLLYTYTTPTVLMRMRKQYATDIVT